MNDKVLAYLILFLLTLGFMENTMSQ